MQSVIIIRTYKSVSISKNRMKKQQASIQKKNAVHCHCHCRRDSIIEIILIISLKIIALAL